MDKKLAVITGATSGIGLEMTRELVDRDYSVVMAVRDKEKAACLAGELINQTSAADLSVLPVDMASLRSIQDFCTRFKELFGQLHILVNNAGVFTDRLQQTEDGFEMTMGVNYLGPYLMTRLLLPVIKKTPAARIINVASRAALHAKLKADANIFSNRRHGFKAYASSKLAQLLFTIDLAEELQASGVTVNAAYPGRVATNIWKGSGLLMKVLAPLMMRNSLSAAEGAKTGVYLATSPDVEGVSGKLFYFEEIMEYNRYCLDKDLRQRLIDLSFDAVCGALPELNPQEISRQSTRHNIEK